MRLIKIVPAVIFLAGAAPVFAQQPPTEIATAAGSGTEGDDDNDVEGNPRLGLLGLLGLIGLLGQFRPEPNIHVDARRPTRR